MAITGRSFEVAGIRVVESTYHAFPSGEIVEFDRYRNGLAETHFPQERSRKPYGKFRDFEMAFPCDSKVFYRRKKGIIIGKVYEFCPSDKTTALRVALTCTTVAKLGYTEVFDADKAAVLLNQDDGNLRLDQQIITRQSGGKEIIEAYQIFFLKRD